MEEEGEPGKKKATSYLPIYLFFFNLRIRIYIPIVCLFFSFCLTLLFSSLVFTPLDPLDGGFAPAFLVLGCAGWSDGFLFRFCIIVI